MNLRHKERNVKKIHYTHTQTHIRIEEKIGVETTLSTRRNKTKESKVHTIDNNGNNVNVCVGVCLRACMIVSMFISP